jgi:hypothetical protein
MNNSRVESDQDFRNSRGPQGLQMTRLSSGAVNVARTAAVAALGIGDHYQHRDACQCVAALACLWA